MAAAVSLALLCRQMEQQPIVVDRLEGNGFRNDRRLDSEVNKQALRSRTESSSSRRVICSKLRRPITMAISSPYHPAS